MRGLDLKKKKKTTHKKQKVSKLEKIKQILRFK